jgi:hypothetical protein
MQLCLAGKIALANGSYRGTGEIIAKRLTEKGTTVFAHGFERSKQPPPTPNDP